MACECGAKPHSKEECSDEKSESDSTSDPGEQRSCCCTHGLRCTCALKKEHLNPVPEADPPVIPPIRRTSSKKPRLAKAGSDSSMTVFANGHHKPTHRNNASAHTCGVPYKIPIPHSVAGNADVARRSAESLPLLKRRNSPRTDTLNLNRGSRLSKSEQNSPLPRDKSSLPSLDFTFSPGDNAPVFDDYFQTPFYTSPDIPPLSAGMSMPPAAEWILPLDVSNIYHPPSFTDYQRPALTTSSSGEHSDVSDYVSHTSAKSNLSPSKPKEPTIDRLSSSYPTTQNLPLEFENCIPPTTASPKQVEEASPGNNLRSEAFEKHGLSVHDIQRLAHPETPTEAMGGLKLPATQEEKTIWARLSGPGATSFVSQQEVESNSLQR